jgi:hypothetical protein
MPPSAKVLSGIGERGTQRARQLVDDQTWRAGGRRQHVPEIDFELLIAELVLDPRRDREPA